MDEKIFRFIFILAAIVFGLVFIGIFLILLKILLLFMPEINIMGLTIT
ncbi:MAG: hypothetical protein PHR36_02355 [Patescibacteria group bacterium]|nr:hypothetical protein [Patescibacteria group bacterium]